MGCCRHAVGFKSEVQRIYRVYSSGTQSRERTVSTYSCPIGRSLACRLHPSCQLLHGIRRSCIVICPSERFASTCTSSPFRFRFGSSRTGVHEAVSLFCFPHSTLHSTTRSSHRYGYRQTGNPTLHAAARRSAFWNSQTHKGGLLKPSCCTDTSLTLTRPREH